MSIDWKKLKYGFLLFEALICLSIIASLSIYLSIWYIQILTAQNLTMRKTEALLYASNLLEIFCSTGRVPEVGRSPIINSAGLFEIEWQIKSDAKLTNFKNVCIYVKWNENGKKNEVHLSTGIFTP